MCLRLYGRKVDFIETESSIEVREEINNIIYRLLYRKTMIRPDDLINTISNDSIQKVF